MNLLKNRFLLLLITIVVIDTILITLLAFPIIFPAKSQVVSNSNINKITANDPNTFFVDNNLYIRNYLEKNGPVIERMGEITVAIFLPIKTAENSKEFFNAFYENQANKLYASREIFLEDFNVVSLVDLKTEEVKITTLNKEKVSSNFESFVKFLLEQNLLPAYSNSPTQIVLRESIQGETPTLSYSIVSKDLIGLKFTLEKDGKLMLKKTSYLTSQ